MDDSTSGSGSILEHSTVETSSATACDCDDDDKPSWMLKFEWAMEAHEKQQELMRTAEANALMN